MSLVLKNHGVNPAIEVCHCCGKETGIILFGTKYKDKDGKTAEAPRFVNMGNLCKDCKDAIEKGGIFFIECRDGETGDNPYRTGRIIAVKEDAVKNILHDYSKINYVHQSIYEKLFGHVEYLNP